MLPGDADRAATGESLARPSRLLLALGVVAFCVLFAEGAMADWTAVYLRDVAGAGPGLAAAGYAAFSLAMAAGRSVGDPLTTRLGATRLVRVGGLLAAVGVAGALVFPGPWAAIVGFGAVGAGLSVVFQSVLAAAGRLAGNTPGPAIAAVSTFGYAGFLAGPPLIGFVAESLTLRGGLGVVVAAGVLITSLAGTLRRANSVEVGHTESPTASQPRAA